MEKKVRIKRSSGLVGLCIMAICLVMFMNRETYAEQGDYMLKVNVASGCITVYEKGGNGEYNVAVKAFSCSTDDTIVKLDETYSITGQQEWKKMSDGTYSQYVMELSNGISICSSSYTAESKDTLDMARFNGIGSENSVENVWLCTADAKWIYENCKIGNTVVFYSEVNNPGPLVKPETIKLNNQSKFTNWDPTDSDENNPWKNSSARIEGVKDIEITAGEQIDLFRDIKGYDICGNDVTKNIIIMGSYDFNKEGTYTIMYYLKDATGSQINKSANLIVKKGKNIQSGQTDTNNTATASEISREKSNGEKMRILIEIGIVAFAVAFGIIRYTKR